MLADQQPDHVTTFFNLILFPLFPRLISLPSFYSFPKDTVNFAYSYNHLRHSRTRFTKSQIFSLHPQILFCLPPLDSHSFRQLSLVCAGHCRDRVLADLSCWIAHQGKQAKLLHFLVLGVVCFVFDEQV